MNSLDLQGRKVGPGCPVYLIAEISANHNRDKDTTRRLIDYVIVHELCHLVVHRHNQEFYALLSRVLPDWEQRREKLNTYEF